MVSGQGEGFWELRYSGLAGKLVAMEAKDREGRPCDTGRRWGKGRAGAKPQERRFEEELGSRQRKRKLRAMGEEGSRKGCRRGVHGTKEAATDQFLHFFLLVSGKCYGANVVCVVRLEVNITTQSFFCFLFSHKKAAGRALSAPPTHLWAVWLQLLLQQQKETASVCVCQGPPTRVLHPPRPVL